MNNSLLTKWSKRSTIVVALLVLGASIAGLFTSTPYALETENWLLQARGQDIGNLIAVAVLLVSTYFAKKGSQQAYLLWLGTLFYLLYAYFVYAIAVHFNRLFLVYVAILGLTFYTIAINLSRRAEHPRVSAAKKFASYTLLTTGLLFALLWLAELVPATLSGETPQSIKDAGLWVNPVHVLDLSIVLPGFLATGYLSLKGKKMATYLMAPWLTFSVLMGTSIVAATILMFVNDFENTVPPMIMVSAVVVASLIALIRFLQGVTHENARNL